MNKAILVRLNKSQEDYEFIVMNIYLCWCMDFAINYTNDLQKVVANAPINKYFLTEFKKIETEFLEIMQEYDGATNIKPKDALQVFNRCTIQIFNRYPKILIHEAKKLNIINHDHTAN